MFRTLLLFVKAAVVAFLMTCVLLGVAFWLARSLRDNDPQQTALASASNTVTTALPVSPKTAPAENKPDAPPQKRSGAHKLVSALDFAENVEKSKRRAVQRYPELGVKDSAINREFVRRMRLFQSINPDFFEDAIWPEKLADAMAVDLSLDAQKHPTEAPHSP